MNYQSVEKLQSKFKLNKGWEVFDDGGCYSLDKNLSICGNIWNNLSFGHEIDTRHFKSWKHYSYCEAYPVLGECVYNETYNLWIGEQLELRLDLVKHLVNCYEKGLGGY